MPLLPCKAKILSLLIKQLEKFIPQFKPYTLDHQIVVYAVNDFEIWFKNKYNLKKRSELYKRFGRYLKNKPKEVNIFISLWVLKWFDKWKERVKIITKKPNIPNYYSKKILKAKKMYLNGKNSLKLKHIVSKKLIKNGEICLSEIIAEKLIIDEIAKSVDFNTKNKKLKYNELNILNNISMKITGLISERGPIIFLNVKSK